MAAVLAAVASAEWTISEEEKSEAYNRSSRTKTQIKLDPLQICLFPTFLGLPEKSLQQDLRDSVETLVADQLGQDYGVDFSYFKVTGTDASIDWYSGESSQPVCGSLNHRLPESNGNMSPMLPRAGVDKDPNQETVPCTCALYSGAVVLLETATDESSLSQTLESSIASVLEEKLAATLHNKPSNEALLDAPFYTEVKGASISWNAAERKDGGRLVLPSTSAGTEQLAKPEQEETTEAIFGDNGSTVINIAKIEEQKNEQQPSANAFDTTKGKILAGVVGGLVLLALLWICCRLRRSQREDRLEEQHDTIPVKDTSTVISQDDYAKDTVDEEISRPRPQRSSSVSMEEDVDVEEASATAQYKDSTLRTSHLRNESNGSLLDCISVGSEWTLTTGVTGVTSALGFHKKTRAELMAAKETFDRDRQITLQKDMLQSEWSGGNAAAAIALKPQIDALQFQDATGQGEEVFIVEPANR